MSITSQLATSDSKKVLIFSAQTPPMSNKQIYFLFSQHQMEDVLMDASMRSVPFSPPYIEGIAEWRDQVLPVISLETCLGLKSLNSAKIQRLMVVRAFRNRAAPMGFHRIMLQIVPPIRILTLPVECVPVSARWIPENFFTKGVYEWEEGILVVVHMKNILTGIN
jgi:chemotaxis signal transduction protein